MATCADCGKILSRYSPGPLCSGCAWDARVRVGEPPRLDQAFWEQPAISQAARDRDMQTFVRAYLSATGLTQEAFALLIESDQGTVSKIVSGRRKRFAIEDFEAIRDGLHAPGHLFGLTPGPHETGQSPIRRKSAQDRDEVTRSVAAVPDLKDAEVERRQLLRHATALGLSAGAIGPWSVGGNADVDQEMIAATVERPVLIDARTIETLGTVLSHQRRLEDVVGSAPMLQPAHAHLALVTRLLHEARTSDTIGQRLAAVGADASQFVGWLRVATGAHAAAGPAYDASLRLALQAGDTDLAATALSMRGHLAWVTGDLREMADLSRAAGELASSPATRATAAQQAGRALALMGDRPGALRAIDQAEEALTADGQTENPDLLYFSGPGLLLAQRGLILAYLAENRAQHAEAADTIARGATALPPETRDAGWFAWYRVQMARERAHSGEPTEGASELRKVLQLASSDKTQAEIKDLHDAMASRWPGDDEVKKLSQALAT